MHGCLSASVCVRGESLAQRGHALDFAAFIRKHGLFELLNLDIGSSQGCLSCLPRSFCFHFSSLQPGLPGPSLFPPPFFLSFLDLKMVSASRTDSVVFCGSCGLACSLAVC